VPYPSTWRVLLGRLATGLESRSRHRVLGVRLLYSPLHTKGIMMDLIKVDKDQLLETLRENRENHINTYDEVLQAYRDKSVELLEEHIERIRSGAVEKVNVNLPVPENHEDEYDRAISMVEWHQGETIELDSYEFDNFVRDKWRWKNEFVEMSMTYGVGAR